MQSLETGEQFLDMAVEKLMEVRMMMSWLRVDAEKEQCLRESSDGDLGVRFGEWSCLREMLEMIGWPGVACSSTRTCCVQPKARGGHVGYDGSAAAGRWTNSPRAMACGYVQ